MATLRNPKHEIFAQELAKGKSALEAYGLAGFKPSRPNASRLQHDDNVVQRVKQILAEREALHGQATADAVKATGLTKEWVIEMLTQNVAKAMQAKAVLNDDGEAVGEYQYQGNVANRALELLGKEIGMFIDRKEVGKPGEFDSLNADERQRLLDAIERELAVGESQVAGTQSPGPAGPVSSLH